MEIIDNLYVEKNKTFESPSDLLLWMLPEDSTSFMQATYYDKDCTKFHCDAARRSFDDLYVLFTTYFPNITKKEVLQVFIDCKIKFYLCGDIKRLVFHRRSFTAEFHLERLITYNDEYSEYAKNYKDSGNTEYTMEDLINILKEE